MGKIFSLRATASSAMLLALKSKSMQWCRVSIQGDLPGPLTFLRIVVKIYGRNKIERSWGGMYDSTYAVPQLDFIGSAAPGALHSNTFDNEISVYPTLFA